MNTKQEKLWLMGALAAPLPYEGRPCARSHRVPEGLPHAFATVLCTRAPGHTGPHVAHGWRDEILAVWENTADAELAEGADA